MMQTMDWEHLSHGILYVFHIEFNHIKFYEKISVS